ncbi:DUF1212-domain-containing protein [Coniophora puteana RWD-64-598 SS2]|uniref:DUF1212-domain-containing protein n=1 Tax=Coniophora puteana (strain RWD-64-598) TaxID=741705 RepID=A0A5M3MJU9_CONPW|nr:DUF1212-domain-containing protein [Coniophora puteana RWD-64-598 SS2]EIW79287.1 DUF1212-domain-containing protein [Coniophora puteana RWD-64-598 SS2]
MHRRRDFILILARCLLAYGAPSHRIESQLSFASKTLDVHAAFMYIPGLIMITFGHEETASVETRFIKATGRISLTPLHRVHVVYRDVLRKTLSVKDGISNLKDILQSPPVYGLAFRCFLSFVSASVICMSAFGGSIIDMGFSGICAAFLQYLGLHAAAKSAMYANVYEITVSILVSFVARALGSIPGNIFCYNAISSAGVVTILPGFTILISALELTSRNIFCGSVRLVYAIIYTLFLGFGMTIGSDVYLVVNKHARHALEALSVPEYTMFHGAFTPSNGSFPLNGNAIFGFANATLTNSGITQQGCLRDPSWPWWRQPVPWWGLFILVPIYSLCSSMGNLQHWRSRQLIVMVVFSCISYASNHIVNKLLPGRSDIVSGAGALVIGLLGNVYSRLVHGTAFTSMVTGVLFLVPSGIAQGGGLLSNQSSEQQYSAGFDLAIRMIEVAIGITVGLFVSQILVVIIGRSKKVAYFAF